MGMNLNGILNGLWQPRQNGKVIKSESSLFYLFLLTGITLWKTTHGETRSENNLQMVDFLHLL